MSTRNILDHLGNIIGELTLPDTTTEGEWTIALTSYTVNSPISAVSILTTYTVSSVATVTTSSSTAATVGGMSIVPAAGKYLADFNGGIYTAGASATGEFGIYVDGVVLPETLRDISCNLSLLGGLVTVSLNSIGVGTCTKTEILLNGSQTIDVKFKSTNGGTIGFNERVFNLIKIS